MKRDHFQISFLSDEREPRLSRSQSVDGEDEITETDGIDVDNAEGCDSDFNEEDSEIVEEEDINEWFWGGMEDLGSVARVGREEAGEDREMWAELDSARNSEVLVEEEEAVPGPRDSEVSINDSVSPIIYQRRYTYYVRQNNQPSEGGGGNEDLNNASEEMGDTNRIVQAPMAAAEEIPEESGRSKRRRIPRKHADALNGCLCGQVLDSSLNGVIECKQAGCETQWVSIAAFYEHG
jgi:hypothetical protein